MTFGLSTSPYPRAQTGNNETALIVGHYALDVADLEIPGLGDDPDTRLGPTRPGDHAADVVTIDRDSRTALLRA
jgi:hypothetical protein